MSVWLARRFVGEPDRRAAILLALAPLLLTGKAILLGRLYGPSDLYFAEPPWSGIAAQSGITRIANPILSDLAFANLPWRAAVREAFAHGRFPFWNRFVLGGTPLLSAAQAAVFHPSTWAGIFLPLPLSWTFSCAFTLFLAFLSAFLYFREFRLSELAALVGAAGWGFSTYVVFWDGWSVGTSTATLPLLLLAVRRLARGESRGFGLTVVSLLLMIAGGHPESWLHGAAVAAVFFLWELAARRRAQVVAALRRAAGAAVVALLLSAPQLFPLLEAIPHSAEYHARRAALESPGSSQSVTAAEAMRRMLPTVLPFAHGIYGRSPVQAERADGSGVPFAYAGALLFPLATLGFFARGRRERARTIFILCLAAGVLAGASAPGLLDLLARLPLFSMALNYRLVFLAGLGLSGLAAFGVEAIREEHGRAAVLAAGFAVILGVSFLLARGVFRDRGLSDSFVGVSAAVEIVPLLLLAALCALGPARTLAAGALLLLVSQRGLEMGSTYPTLPAETLAPPLPGLEIAGRSGPARLAATGETFRPNAAALYLVEDVRGYESIVLDRLADTFPLWSAPQPASFNRVDDLERPFLSFLNARYAVAPPETPPPPRWVSVSRTDAMAVFENPRALPRAFAPRTIRFEADARRTLAEMQAASDFGETVWVEMRASESSAVNGSASVDLRAVGPDLIVGVDAVSRALVATSIPAWPGWRARSGAENLPIVFVDHAFVGFFAPPGRSVVRLHYRPRSWNSALWSLAAGLLALAWAQWLRVRRDRNGRSRADRQDTIRL